MKDITRKVVILDNITSPYIHQAIIVLKDKARDSGPAVMEEAERVVNEYLSKINTDDMEVTLYSRPYEKAKKSKLPFYMACALLALSAVLLFCIIR